jgi:hypothetical protein
MKKMSTKGYWKRKKYMGVCRWESEIVTIMMSSLPKSAIRYIGKTQPVGAEILVSLKTSEEKMVKILHHFLVP